MSTRRRLTNTAADVKHIPLVRRPIVYEINTRVWLDTLSREKGKKIHLGTVPRAEWNAIGKSGVDAVWLMGVWERSAAGIDVSNHDEPLVDEFQQVLPDYTPEDNVGSPYCVRDYRVAEYLGGPDGLAKARRALASMGLSLILDYVPNHTALDHPWVTEHPEYFVRGTEEDLAQSPRYYFKSGGNIIANGRDPYFPAWTDVAQLNPYNTRLRKAVAETITDIAGRCDGIRCDMAMLMLNDIFQRTWGEKAGKPPETEFWTDIINATKKHYPDFTFIAEVYWDLEWNLQQLGFDYCYDKRLYDRLVHENGTSVRNHLKADMDYQERLVRFIENHDEPRAATMFHDAKARVAAILCCTLPGALLLHQGQFEGFRVRFPVFLRRGPQEHVDRGLQHFYLSLLALMRETGLKQGEWYLCDTSGWPDNQSYLNMVAWSWQNEDRHILIAVNLSDGYSQGKIKVPWIKPDVSVWELQDLMNPAINYRRAHEDLTPGLYVELPPWGYHFFQFTPARESTLAIKS